MLCVYAKQYAKKLFIVILSEVLSSQKVMAQRTHSPLYYVKLIWTVCGDEQRCFALLEPVVTSFLAVDIIVIMKLNGDCIFFSLDFYWKNNSLNIRAKFSSSSLEPLFHIHVLDQKEPNPSKLWMRLNWVFMNLTFSFFFLMWPFLFLLIALPFMVKYVLGEVSLAKAHTHKTLCWIVCFFFKKK